MERRIFLKTLPVGGAGILLPQVKGFAYEDTITRPVGPVIEGNDRAYWAGLLEKIITPVLENLSKNRLKANMPLEKPGDYNTVVEKVSYLEAFGRTVCGAAPWLGLPDDGTAEGNVRKILHGYYLQGMANAVDPNAPDYLNFRQLPQPLVDAAHLCQGILRAPERLWEPLNKETKERFINELKQLRRITPAYNNWLLFAAMVETFLLYVRHEHEPLRVLVGVRKMQEWYKGDGWYADGPDFAMDYYNSYVIHSMLTDVLRINAERSMIRREEYEQALKRMQRYGVLLERMISPEGTYPAIGRSMTYRTAAFQPLSQLALEHKLPEALSPAQVRCAITAVMKRMFSNKDNFDSKGWLQIGICGSQRMVADPYTSTGSLYICTEGFLALGLPADDPFWVSPPAEWTAQKVWAGKPVLNDHAAHY